MMADLVVAERPEDAVTPVSRVHYRPERAGDLERWLVKSGFAVTRDWQHCDLVVMRRANSTRG